MILSKRWLKEGEKRYLLFENWMVLHLNRHESLSSKYAYKLCKIWLKLAQGFPKDALCHVWLKLAQWFWRRRILNSSMHFHYFVIISLWKRAGTFFKLIWIPIAQGCFVLSLIEIDTLVLARKILKNIFDVFFFVINSPWKRAGPFI